jgi:hypothetical protein
MSVAETGELTSQSPSHESSMSMAVSGVGRDRSQSTVRGASGAVDCRPVQGHLPGGNGADGAGAVGFAGFLQCSQQDRVRGWAGLRCWDAWRWTMQHQPGGNARSRPQARTRYLRKGERMPVLFVSGEG